MDSIGKRQIVARGEVSTWFDAIYRGDLRYKDSLTILDCANDLGASPAAVAVHWPSAPDLQVRAKLADACLADLIREYAERYPHHTQAMCAYMLGCTPSLVSKYATGQFIRCKSPYIVARVLEDNPDANTQDFIRAGLSRVTAWRYKK